MNQIVAPNARNIFKREMILFEERQKKEGRIYLTKKHVAYLKHEYKLHLYFNMPQSVIGYEGNPDGDKMWTPWYQDIKDICWHCPSVSQDHLHLYAFPVTEEYISTKLAFGYKLVRNSSSSAFDTRLVPEQVWDKQIQDTRWCNKCGGSKHTPQSG